MVTVAQTVRASADPLDLLELDAADPFMQLDQPRLWQLLLGGEGSEMLLRRAIANFYPVVGGPGRYAFASRLSRLQHEHAAIAFQEIYENLKEPVANPDAGWRKVGRAIGVSDEDFDAVLAAPPPEAVDLVDVVRQHGYRSAHEAVGTAWALERQLPRLWGRFADVLTGQHGVREEDVAYLRFRASRVEQVDAHVHELVTTYLQDPWPVFEARRAARECAWAWIALSETVVK